MSEKTLGEKHECPECGVKFYDLGRTPKCPACGWDSTGGSKATDSETDEAEEE